MVQSGPLTGAIDPPTPPPPDSTTDRSVEDCLTVIQSSDDGILSLTDSELVTLVSRKLVRGYKLESLLRNDKRGEDFEEFNLIFIFLIPIEVLKIDVN